MDWLIRVFDADTLNCTQSRHPLDQPRRGRAEHHATRRCPRLHPLGHTDLLTNGGVTERPRTDFTGDHLTGVKSHPQLQVHTVAPSDIDCDRLGLLLNPQGRQTRTNSVILQGHRCTEYRHDPYGHTIGMLVDEHHRGQGVGGALLGQLISWATARGIPHLSLLVFPHNERALALYRKFDFVEIDAQAAQIARRSGEAWDAILMRRQLE